METLLESQLKKLEKIVSRNATLNYLMPAIEEALAIGFRQKEVVKLLANYSIEIKPEAFRKRLYAFRKKTLLLGKN
ncbi:hypothetical protein FBY51_1866 [Zymomonas mobilis]|uniref:hypothetical protein n=1 Tax=Zymomonas mobilis TaxID=542 RepID=UPI00026D8210|nr:hypothetical protein [Zymomonas mobilis]AFN57606.1 hypothetical protein ZZ6_1755 [Zymomonas mobilis subsp. mobilis ATCC 29191]TQK75375.1 hypothetical protein FBY53_1806 [Zymomonas mobilis]TQL14607.1 hypothetical protein FBY51_1866 [Zymomonas mobilis]